MRRQHTRGMYRVELLVIRLRDLIRSPLRVLQECGVAPGMTVLDFGCGPGGFSLAAARLVGSAGKVYAVDVQELALDRVRRVAARHGLRNIEAIHSSRIGAVGSESVDMALAYDVLHIHPEPAWTTGTLAVLHRVLTPAGVLSVRDHHLKGDALVSLVMHGGLFQYACESGGSSQFVKIARGQGNP